MKITVDKLLKIVKSSKGKVKKDSYVMCYADVKSEGSDMNGICVGVAFGKYGIRFLISDDDNVMDYIDQFDDIVNHQLTFNAVFKDSEPYSMTNYEFVDALFKYEAQLIKKGIDAKTLKVDVDAALAGGFECTFKNFEMSNGTFNVNVLCEDFE